jgi:hypothetical protein
MIRSVRLSCAAIYSAMSTPVRRWGLLPGWASSMNV